MVHTVKFEIPRRDLGKANVEFVVYRDGEVFGKLLVSKGAVVWRRKWQSKRGRKIGWDKFDSLMLGHARSVKGG